LIEPARDVIAKADGIPRFFCAMNPGDPSSSVCITDSADYTN
jgi:hypothetical protein